MSAMREAFEKFSPVYAANIEMHKAGSMDYLDAMVAIRAERNFEAGWQAAIEHIKAQGAAAYVENQLFMDGVSTIISVPLPVGTELYRIPEDV